MILLVAIGLLIGFCVAWIWRDVVWSRAATSKKFVVVNGKIYTVKCEGWKKIYDALHAGNNL